MTSTLPETPFGFPSADGAATIEGVLHQPAQADQLAPVLIVSHGRWNNLGLPLLHDLCQRAAEEGWRALRFNFRYVTQKHAPSPNGADEVADLQGALAAVRTEFRSSPGRTYLAGKSLGAVVAGHVAAAHSGLGGYIALGYPLHAPGGDVSADTSDLARLGCPALFAIGDRDPFCRLDLLQPILTTVTTSCTLEVIAGGDHSFRPPHVSEASDEYLPQALDVTLRWMQLQIGG